MRRAFALPSPTEPELPHGYVRGGEDIDRARFLRIVEAGVAKLSVIGKP